MPPFVLVALTALTVLLGDPQPGSGPSTLDELQEARIRWARAGVSAYAFDVRTVCFCFPSNGRVRVRDGRVAAFRSVRPALPPEAGDHYWVLTVEGYFDRIAELARGNPDVLRVTYDPHYGFPTRIEYDGNRLLHDDERTVTLSGFAAE